jgi:hypothetical protein
MLLTKLEGPSKKPKKKLNCIFYFKNGFFNFHSLKPPAWIRIPRKSRHGPIPDELTPDPQHWYTEDHLSTVLSCLNRRLWPEDYSELPPLPL